MFFFVPVQQVQIVGGQAAQGTYKGFLCVDLSYVSITTIPWSHNEVTLGTALFSFTINPYDHRVFSLDLFFLNWWWWWDQCCWLYWGATCFNYFHWEQGRSQSHYPLQVSEELQQFSQSWFITHLLEISHPCATALWALLSILCPAATVLTTANKHNIQFNMFDIESITVTVLCIKWFNGSGIVYCTSN